MPLTCACKAFDPRGAPLCREPIDPDAGTCNSPAGYFDFGAPGVKTFEVGYDSRQVDESKCRIILSGIAEPDEP